MSELDISENEYNTEPTPAARLAGVSLRYGGAPALDGITLDLPAGRMVGLIGPDGVGKSSLLSLIAGARRIQGGSVQVLGGDMADAEYRRATCPSIAYMPQGLGKNLYPTLSVFEDAEFFGRLFGHGRRECERRIADLLGSTGMAPFADRPAGKLSGGMKQKLSLCCALIHDPELLILDEPTTRVDPHPLGQRQRLSLAVAVIHRPEPLILDEPTSGVDPVARDSFWKLLIELSRRDKVTIFISTHFMNEARPCDRISLKHAGKVLASDAPAALVRRRGTATLEEAFIDDLEEAASEVRAAGPEPAEAQAPPAAARHPDSNERPLGDAFSFRRLMSYTRREVLELSRDPIRMTMAGLGSLILMVLMGYGITLDVERLSFAVLDRDQTTASRDYVLNIAGTPRYFVERAPIVDYGDLDRRMRSGDLSMAVEIPPNFGRDIERGRPVQVGLWIDGAQTTRLEFLLGKQVASVVLGRLNSLLPLQALTGGLTPRESMPEPIQNVMLGAPTMHFVILAQQILYRGAGLEVVWRPFLALAAIGAVLFGIALARFRKTIGTMA